MNPKLRISGILFCQFEASAKLSGEVTGEVENFLTQAKGTQHPVADAIIFQSHVRRNIKLWPRRRIVWAVDFFSMHRPVPWRGGLWGAGGRGDEDGDDDHDDVTRSHEGDEDYEGVFGVGVRAFPLMMYHIHSFGRSLGNQSDRCGRLATDSTSAQLRARRGAPALAKAHMHSIGFKSGENTAAGNAQLGSHAASSRLYPPLYGVAGCPSPPRRPP